MKVKIKETDKKKALKILIKEMNSEDTDKYTVWGGDLISFVEHLILTRKNYRRAEEYISRVCEDIKSNFGYQRAFAIRDYKNMWRDLHTWVDQMYDNKSNIVERAFIGMISREMKKVEEEQDIALSEVK